MIKNIIYFFIIKFNILIVFENRKRIINLKYHKKEVQLSQRGIFTFKKRMGERRGGVGGLFSMLLLLQLYKGEREKHMQNPEI